MGNANKAATYDRATAAVNEAPRAPGSPALAVPKAPRAPAAPALEEDDQPLDMDLVKQIYRNNKDIIGANPNIIEPKTIIDLPDGTPYEIQPGDTLSKIARNIPAIKAAAAASNKVVAAEPSFLDKLKQAASGIAAGQFPSQAIPDAFPSLKKPAPVAAPAPTVKAAPEKVSPADSLDSDEQIVVKSKVKPNLPPRTPSPQPFMPAGANPERPKPPYVPTPRPTGKEPTPTTTPTGIPAAAEKTGRIVDKVGKSAEKAVDWIGDKIATRAETPGSKSPYTQKNILGSSAYGRYQFMPDTFKGLVALAKPGDELYGKTWKDFKKDPALQDATMKVADNYYTDVLSRNKIPATDSNKYLSHFVGAENAVNMINTKSAKTPLKDLYPDYKLEHGETIPNKFFTKNNFSTDMTVGDLRKWADARIAAPPAKKKTKESAVAETVQTVKVMLETATTRDDVRRIKDYIDRQYTRHGLSDSVSFAQRNHLVERVIEITAKRLLLV